MSLGFTMALMIALKLLLVLKITDNYAASSFEDIDLPPYLFSIYEHQRRMGDNSSAKTKPLPENEIPECYGFEEKCEASKRYRPNSPHSCTGREHWNYWIQGDFGYIRKQLDSLFPACTGRISSLQCTEWMQLCLANKLYVDLTKKTSRRWPPHLVDVFTSGEIGGACDVNREVILRQEYNKHVTGGLRSWFPELKEFSKIEDFQMNPSFCDVVVDKPVVFMKWDQGDNMYHRICDFFNLYMSLLFNRSFDFNTDILIVSWNWTAAPYHDYFTDSLKVFTKHPVVNLQSWLGKRVCFSSAIFSFLPRMVFGIYYNTNLNEKPKDSARVTFLVRTDYSGGRKQMYRRIVNQDELIEELENISGIELKVVDFQPHLMPFIDQLNLIANTDIFISIHGAGLTHLLFLPDWAVAFELFDCEAKCYRDLARLRGIHHVTWEDQSKLTKHDNANEINLRYYNYSFDRNEFKRLFLRAKSLLEKQKNTITQHIEL